MKEADISYKVRGKNFHFIKVVCVEEKEHCSMRVQEVVFGDFKDAEIPKNEFVELVQRLDHISIPFPEYSDGKSGDTHQLDIQCGENSINLKWFGDSPGEKWKGIVGFTDDLVALKGKYIK